MKKSDLLNQPISNVIAGMGHTDTLAIADAGLPIPVKTQRIDLALTKGVPGFLETLQVVLTELQVEKAIIAEELTTANPELFTVLRETLGNVPIEMVTHDIFKETTSKTHAVIRTGECTPYANVILVAGVTF
ncbi:MAG: D-ribose pyranase [Chloroflexi bacterium]|nr:D-ribose pyranase [Chloroflexota bacterium]